MKQPNAPDILQDIVKHKELEISASQVSNPLSSVIDQLTKIAPARPFKQSIEARIKINRSAVIAEVKRASPSKGVLRDPFDPIFIAQSYEQHGATCLSVLTDQKYFQGHDDYLVAIKSQCGLPILRKDFIIDSYQIYESRSIGADCILLITAILSSDQISEFTMLASELGLSILIEVHTLDELNKIDNKLFLQENVLLGINNRNLHTFETDLNTTLILRKQLHENIIVVTESGIANKSDVHIMHSNGIYTFLIGEAFMRAESPGQALTDLFPN